MGFRWYKGRFLSDDEYNNEIRKEWQFAAALIPITLFGIIGWSIADGWGCFLGIILGLFIGILFNKFFLNLLYLGIASLIIYIIYILLKE